MGQLTRIPDLRRSVWEDRDRPTGEQWICHLQDELLDAHGVRGKQERRKADRMRKEGLLAIWRTDQFESNDWIVRCLLC